METEVAFKNNTKNVLDSKGWSIRKLANELKKDYSHIYRLVTKPIPEGTTIGSLKPIADALGVPVDALIGESDGNPN